MMPYRYAHYVILLALVPAIGLAFWPAYFGNLRGASWAFHAHGLTASCWIILALAQSWTAHAKRFVWHRLAARSVLVLVPLFAAGGALALQGMATKFVTKSDPFYGAFGARLGMDDIVSTIMLVAMVRAAIVNRRRVGLHAAYMLATVALVLPPVFSRLPLPRWWHLADLLTIAIALAVYLARRRDGWPFLLVTVYSVWRIVQFETIAASDWWAAAFAQIKDLPPLPIILGAFVAAGAAIWSAWPWKRTTRVRPLSAA
jgi:hypothetical protein